jgi:Cys-rich repeat protein
VSSLARGMLAAAALGAFAGLACSKRGGAGQGCGADSDCGDAAAFRCDTATGACLCRTSAACSAGEICNDLGYCQSHVGCSDNTDCPTGFLCDSAAGACMALGQCTNDLQCKTGELCDAASKTCRPGCKSSGDCALREVCLCPGSGDAGAAEVPCGCDALDAEGRASCPVGRCSSRTCAVDADCSRGERCRAPPEGGLPICLSDYDPSLRPYCDSCVWTPGRDTCGSGPNFCLYSTYESHLSYCGVDCSQGQSCAHGYECGDVIVVFFQTLCTTTEDCVGTINESSERCSADKPCRFGGLCSPEGYCYGKCTPREGADQSFCSCVKDDDCAQDVCESTTRTCSISRQPCDLHGEGCPKIRCVDFGGQGGCVIGRNCKPQVGLTCADVRPTQ